MTQIQAYVLHFAHCSLDAWTKKYLNLGDFSDHSWLGATIPDFYRRSRDHIKSTNKECSVHKDDKFERCRDKALKEFYKREVTALVP